MGKQRGISGLTLGWHGDTIATHVKSASYQRLVSDVKRNPRNYLQIIFYLLEVLRQKKIPIFSVCFQGSKTCKPFVLNAIIRKQRKIG